MIDLLSQRAVGQLPLSIATSLAIEGAYGVHPDHPSSEVPILKYSSLLVNVRTLFRNMLGSLERNNAGKVSIIELAATLAEEMSFIRTFVEENTSRNGNVKVVFYYSNYNGIEREFKRSVARMDNTEKQKEFSALQAQVMKLLLKNPDLDIKGFELFLKNPNGSNSALILTHFAIDLLSAHEFSKLSLLESHTGFVKGKSQWYTKLHNGSELNQIPFMKCFLTVFGDETLFRPHDRKLRMSILEVAKKYNWSSVTTRDKVRYGLETLLNPYARQIMLDIL